MATILQTIKHHKKLIIKFKLPAICVVVVKPSYNDRLYKSEHYCLVHNFLLIDYYFMLQVVQKPKEKFANLKAVFAICIFHLNFEIGSK